MIAFFFLQLVRRYLFENVQRELPSSCNRWVSNESKQKLFFFNAYTWNLFICLFLFFSIFYFIYFYFYLFLFLFIFYFLFFILKWILSYIEMKQPWVYKCSPSRSHLPPPSPHDPSRSFKLWGSLWILLILLLFKLVPQSLASRIHQRKLYHTVT